MLLCKKQILNKICISDVRKKSVYIRGKNYKRTVFELFVLILAFFVFLI